MKSATNLWILPEARTDIDEIYQYTMTNWDMDQAEKYQLLLDEAFQRIKQFPELGKDAGSGVRELVLRHHIVLYRYDDDTVSILRVLNPLRLRR